MDDDLDAMEGAGTGNTRGLLVALAAVAALVVAAIAVGPLLSPRPEADEQAAEGPAAALAAEGKRLYEWRCVSCHGETGVGDGPIAGDLTGPPPGDLTDDDWKHGDRPDRVLAVIARGVDGTMMAGWDTAFAPDELRALAAYTYRLAGRDVPAELLDGAE
ncbi:c-type cytochrome [Tautonia plasticadhaerens]|uniref:c-type cytochrome n=1 Tax=Tautonia plasticadhaerens TaxID=2527974 RepID=UPI0011AABEDE|nr:c-type cytochrome [Tautonia plasticadhaerens]